MTIFSQMCRELPFYKELIGAVEKGLTPCEVTGVSNIHKAHVALELSEYKPVLLVCDDEASGLRLVNDMNEMAGQEIACHLPARDYNFAYLEGMSREYEHKRIEALSAVMTGKCRVCVASVEACMQGTVPKETLTEYSFSIKTGSEINTHLLSEEHSLHFANMLFEGGFSFAFFAGNFIFNMNQAKQQVIVGKSGIFDL